MQVHVVIVRGPEPVEDSLDAELTKAFTTEKAAQKYIRRMGRKFDAACDEPICYAASSSDGKTSLDYIELSVQE